MWFIAFLTVNFVLDLTLLRKLYAAVRLEEDLLRMLGVVLADLGNFHNNITAGYKYVQAN